MTAIIFLGGLLLVLYVITLSSRVSRLEQLMDHSMARPEPKALGQEQGEKVFSEKQGAVSGALLDYIRQQLRKGEPVGGIKAALLSRGWHISDIEKGFSLVGTVTQLPGDVSLNDSFWSDRFIDWLKEDWLLKLGAFLLLIGFGWLTTYAFLNDWIGPAGRIALGVFAGIFFLILGSWRIQKYVEQGGVFLVLGSTTILLTIFAARAIYGFFTPASALSAMFLSSAFVALASVRFKSRPLSLASLILAGVAPLLTSSPTVDHVGLFSYLLIIILGAIWVVALTGMRELTIVSLLTVAFYSLPFVQRPEAVDTVLLFIYAFAAIFSITNTVSILKSKTEDIIADLLCAAMNGLFLLYWIMIAVPEDWKSSILCAWMLVFALGGFLIFRMTKRREPFYTYLAVSVTMLAAATSVQFEGATMTIAFIVESVVIALVAYALLRDVRVGQHLSLLLIGSALLTPENIASSSWDYGVLNEDFFVLLLLAMAFLGLGLFFRGYLDQSREGEDKSVNAFLLNAGAFYFYLLLWLSACSLFAESNLAIQLPLLVYIILGLLFYFYGLRREKKGIRLHGLALIVFVIARLFSIDVWTMELAGRIVTFFVIGALLVSTAFLSRGKR